MVYIAERLVLQTIYVLNKEILQFLVYNPWFIIKNGFKSRAGYNGARTVFTLAAALNLYSLFWPKNYTLKPNQQFSSFYVTQWFSADAKMYRNSNFIYSFL